MADSVVAARCEKCGKLSYPTHFSCPSCGGTSFESTPVEGGGTLLTWTRVYALPLDYADLFITLGIVEMDSGIRATGRLEIDEPRTGARVRASVGKVREIGGKTISGLVFRTA
ncbi:MAG TPA: OB-fold domain-containing protein [Actinomycetota bacterium]